MALQGMKTRAEKLAQVKPWPFTTHIPKYRWEMPGLEDEEPKKPFGFHMEASDEGLSKG